MKRAFGWFWLGALTVLAIVEIWAVANRVKGDTLSEQVIPLLEHPGVWAITFVFWVLALFLLTWHWFFQYRKR